MVTFPVLGEPELQEDDGCRSINAAAAAATVSDINPADVPGSDSRMETVAAVALNGDDSAVFITMVVVVVVVPEELDAFPDEHDVD